MLDATRGPAPQLDRAAATAIRDRAAAADRGERDLRADLEALSSCGLRLAPLPSEAGGHGYGCEPHAALDLCDVLRAVGHASLSVARIFEGHVNAAKLVALYGTPAQRERVATAVRDGAWMGVWGADGVPPATIEGTGGRALRRADGNDVLAGAKRFASGLGLIGIAVVSAATPDGLQLCVADVADDDRGDASTWRVGGMRATASGTFDLAGLPAERLGAPDDYLREPHFEGGVWRYCAAHLGGAEALHAEMVALLVRMKRDADPHQAHRIARSAAALETARLWIERAAERVEGDGERADGPDPQGAAAYALLAREVTEEACLTVLHTAERALGTVAHGMDLAVERIRRDLGLFLRQANPDGKLARAAATLAARREEADPPRGPLAADL